MWVLPGLWRGRDKPPSSPGSSYLHVGRNQRVTNLIFFLTCPRKRNSIKIKSAVESHEAGELSVSGRHACVNNIKLNCLHLIAAHLITSVIFQGSREILIDPINFPIGTKRYCRHATHAGLSCETVARERSRSSHPRVKAQLAFWPVYSFSAHVFIFNVISTDGLTNKV